MALLDRWAAQAPLCATILVFSGCSGKYEPYPPPKEYPSVAVGVGAGGGGAGGTGSGGSPAWSGNVCECAYDYTFGTACGTCFNKVINDDKACKPQILQCAIDSTCIGLVNCPGSKCYMQGVPPGPAEVACVQGCYVPWTQDTAHMLFMDVMTCACNACAKECAPEQAIACDTGSMSGGSSSSSGP